MTLDLDAIRARYDRAIEAKPSKGDYSPDGIAAITDSVCDVPELIKALKAASNAQSLPPTEEHITDVILNYSGRLGVHYADVARACAEAIHKLYPTCQPSERAVADLLRSWGVRSGHGEWTDAETQAHVARSVLALLPGRSEAEVKAEAWREAIALLKAADPIETALMGVDYPLAVLGDLLVGGEGRG